MSLYDVLSDQESSVQMIPMTIGIVTNINDPDKKGRIKVKLVNRSKSDYETDFIRVMTPLSGKNAGVYFIPDVGAEVLVGFCDGNIQSPYVLGCLWNGDDTQPYQMADGKNDIKMIKTKTGHLIQFNEEKDNEGIEITTVKGLSIVMLDKDEKITIGDKDKSNSVLIDSKGKEIKITATDKLSICVGSNEVSLDKNNITIKGKTKISLDAQDIKLTAKNNLELAGANVKINAKASAEIKANAKMDVSASGPLSLKGAIVKIN